jgi:asparagine synthetase B (glutamine-hydrolysing)
LFNTGWIKETTLRRRYTQETNDRLGDTQAKSILSDYLKKCNARDYFNKLLYIDFKTWNSRRNLIANERLFGAFGIVSHIPFLDVDLIEFSSSWPIAMKHSFKDSKYCIRKYFRDEKFLPRAVFDKGKKDSLLRFPYWQNDTLDAILHFADRLRTRRLFNENFIDKVLSRAKNRPDRAYQYLVFGFFVLELWLRIFVDRSEIAERDLTLDHLAQDAP